MQIKNADKRPESPQETRKSAHWQKNPINYSEHNIINRSNDAAANDAHLASMNSISHAIINCDQNYFRPRLVEDDNQQQTSHNKLPDQPFCTTFGKIHAAPCRLRNVFKCIATKGDQPVEPCKSLKQQQPRSKPPISTCCRQNLFVLTSSTVDYKPLSSKPKNIIYSSKVW